ncbi:hypothetical protein HAX54_026799, partial [Datura stramonium]|nr:hypothetical protein [Datura stramonium]
MGAIEMYGVDLGTVIFSDSLWFADWYRRLAAILLVDNCYAQYFAVHLRVSGGSRTPPATRRCFANATGPLNN